jgi:hypothetical protein
LTNVPVILHERLGNWARQLRPRLNDLPIRLIETRSRADLEAILTGIASPVVLIDPGKHIANGLLDIELVLNQAPDALVLVNNPESNPEVASLAREFGATHVLSGFVPPPDVAGLLLRWILLAQREIEHDGWSRNSAPESNPTEDHPDVR